MPQTYLDADGNEVEAIPMEEFQKIQEERDALAKEKEELAAEKERLEKGGQDKDENFKSFRAKLENTENALKDVTERLTQKEQYEKTSVKNTLINYFAGADEESRKRLEEEYALINLDETTPENITIRMEKAAKMSGLFKEQDTRNPVFQTVFGGSGPVLKPNKTGGADDSEFLNSPKGKAGLEAMGLPADTK